MKNVSPGDPDLLAAWFVQANDLLLATDRHGRLLTANPAFRQRFDAADSLAALTPAGDAGDACRATLAEALRDGRLERVELPLGDGWFVVSGRAAGDRIAWVLQDITAQRQLAAQARHLQDLLDMAQEFGRLGVWEREIASGAGRWDRHVFGFWGRDPALGTPSHAEAMSSLHPDDRERLDFQDSTQKAGRYAMRYRVIRPDGTLRWVHSQWEIRNGPQGRPERAVGIMMDDTEVYELARSLGDASAQLKLAVEVADISIWRHDLRSNRMHYNDRAYAVLGISPRPEGMSIDEVRALIHPDDLPEVLASADRALRSDRPTDMQARYRRSDGTWRHILTRRVAQRAPDGRPIAFVGVALDVTEQFERQREAHELAKRLEIAASAAGVGIWSRDPATEQGEWNLQMFELYGRLPALGVPSRDEWIEHLIHPDDRAAMRNARPQLLDGPDATVEHEYRIVRPDGQVRWLVNRARREPWNDRQMIFGVTLDITERRRAELALRSADERAALAARAAGIGTWEIQREGGIERWDEQMFRLRGLEPGPTPPNREQRLALLHPDDRAGNVDTQGDAMGGPQPTRYEFRVVLPDGSHRWLASRSIPVLDAQGTVARRIGVNWDVTDTKQAEQARQQTLVAERASQAKSQFLARMSHELRTPLNAVLGFTQLLQIETDATRDAARAAKLGHIRSAGEHLLALINGVLDLSSLEAGSLRLALEPVELAALVEQALPLVAVLAQQHQVQLRCGEITGIVEADRTRALQVLVNLLSNAIKYNRPGGEVLVETHPGAERIVLQVSDTGRGMTAEQQAQLFEPFNRLGAEREGIEGTGIGLTIVKALLASMGGRILVSSRAGEGSRFGIELPRVHGQAGSGAGAAATEVLPQRQPRRSGQLLYIEDNLVNVMLVEELVRGLAGLEITSETSGAAGVARAAQLRPDLVLIDMQLPDFDGFEVLRRLRAQPATANVPCIALSANAMPEDIALARRTGFADYWTKPIDFNAFLAALDKLFPERALSEGI